jgi:hypothetical protein
MEDAKICECGRSFTESQSTGRWCFRCKLEGIRFNWVGGGGYGRQAFHDKTVGEVQREHVEGAARAGITTMEKLPERAELI